MCLTLFGLVVCFVSALTLIASPASAFHLGLAWAADNQWAHELVGNPNVDVYHRWQMQPVKSLDNAGLRFVPMRWGRQKNGPWKKIKRQLPQLRQRDILAYNEPDVPSQSNYSPKAAAKAFQRELAPLRQAYGSRIAAPSICYDVQWLEKFMRILHKQGGHADFLSVHYYGGWNLLHKLKKYIHKIHKKFPNKSIWVTEYGITSSSNPSAAQAKQFMVEAAKFFASTGYVKAAFPFGMFATPPDSFGSRQNAAFKNSGHLRSLGKYYKHYGTHKRSLASGHEMSGALLRRHERFLKRLELPDSDDEELWDNHPNPTDCDDVCQKRDTWLMSDASDKPFDPETPIDGEDDDDDEHDADLVDFTEEDKFASLTAEEEEDD